MDNVSSHSQSTPAQTTNPKLRIYAFGALQVVRDDQAVTETDWHTRQARQILKILLTERPRPVSSDRLIEILWPTSTPEAAATTLRSAVNALRNVLEPERRSRAPSRYIVTETPGYAFRNDGEIWLDVDAFEQALDQAPRLSSPQQQRHALAEAIDLYQDDYLTSDPYADWAQSERERLRECYFTALLQIAELYAQEQQYSAAMAACRRILARDEVRETAYQALMRYQAESGDSASALLTYERCRTILAEELGADPSPLTQAWHQRILNGEIVAIAPPAPSTMRPATAVASLSLSGKRPEATGAIPNLPQLTFLPLLDDHALALLIGREAESIQLQAHLQAALAGKGSILLLEGEAGVGKTRLAYHTLQQALQNNATVISATCQNLDRTLPYTPLADSLGRYLHALPLEALHLLPATALAQLAQLIPSLYDRLPDLPRLANELLLQADENRLRLIDGVVTLLAALAQSRPLIFFLDDLQWADGDTLAVLNRLAPRLAALPLLLLLAYRSDDLAENENLETFWHALKRTYPQAFIQVQRFDAQQVAQFVDQMIGQPSKSSAELAELLYQTTQGNALFVTEALRDLQERYTVLVTPATPDGSERKGWARLLQDWSNEVRPILLLQRNARVQEIILERIRRLPSPARNLLQLCAVIGRDFSLELLERAAQQDPLEDLAVLIQRKFLIERPDERIDFSHQLVRQVAYAHMMVLQRRRLHLRVADALAASARAGAIPNEIAFHYEQAGASANVQFAHYTILACERLLHTYGFRQAIAGFDRALTILEQMPGDDPQWARRALQGRGLAYESLFDLQGITTTHRRLQEWARRQGDRQLFLAAQGRLASMLGLLGQQRESNALLRELIDALAKTDTTTSRGVQSALMQDLFERRQRIYSPDRALAEDEWSPYVPPPPVVTNPVADIQQILEPVHAVLPLLDYGWTLLVQGQVMAALHCLNAVVDLAKQTGQPSIAGAAYHQLAMAARLLGDVEQSHSFNEQSLLINRDLRGATAQSPAAELTGMFPRITSGFLALELSRLDEAERRFQRVLALVGEQDTFRNYRSSARVGLGLVALAQNQIEQAEQLIDPALADPINLYPYIHVRALLGLARIAHLQGEAKTSRLLLQQALHFAGQRSLLQEYVEALLETARLQPAGAPVQSLLQTMSTYVTAIGLNAVARRLEGA